MGSERNRRLTQWTPDAMDAIDAIDAIDATDAIDALNAIDATDAIDATNPSPLTIKANNITHINISIT